MGLHGLLRDVGEHGVGAAESDHGELAEKQADLKEQAAARKGEQGQGREPKAEPDGQRAQRGADRGRRDGAFLDLLRGAATEHGEAARVDPAADQADQPGAEHDQGEGRTQGEHGHEGRRRQSDHGAVLQDAAADAQQRLDHDGEHRGLHAEEQRRHQRRLAVGGVQPSERKHHGRAGQDEQHTRDQPAARAVQQPADIGGELHGLRPRQEHAEIQRVHEARVGDPAPLVDHDAMHEGDLPGRTAEAEQADAQPDPRRLGQPDRDRGRATHAVAAGQLWRSSAAKRAQA